MMKMIQMSEDLKNEIRMLSEELKNDTSIWNEEDEFIIWLKKAFNALDESERYIMLLYTHLASLREVGKVLGISHTIIRKEITRLRLKMYAYVKDNCNSDNHLLLDRFNRYYNDN